MFNKVMFSSKSDNWSTPQKLFDQLNSEFKFTLDPCADEFNCKCEKYYTLEMDGLSMPWESDERIFINPPYGRVLKKWVEKAYFVNKEQGNLIVMLIPSRTDTAWFHDYIYNNPKVEIRFIKGRLYFGDAQSPAPFPSMIVIFN